MSLTSPIMMSKGSSSFSSPLLDGLPHAVRASVLAAARAAEIPADVQLCVEGETATQLFLLKKGQVRYYRLTRDGKQTILYWLGPGDTFGLGTLLTEPGPYLGSAGSVSPCQILSWEHTAIRSLALAYPQLACNAVGVVLHYLSLIAERHSGIFGSTAVDRIARALLDLGNRTGHVTPHGVDLHITNEELASLADVSPFTVSRTLSHWKREGALTKQRKALCIHAPERLVQHPR